MGWHTHLWRGGTRPSSPISAEQPSLSISSRLPEKNTAGSDSQLRNSRGYRWEERETEGQRQRKREREREMETNRVERERGWRGRGRGWREREREGERKRVESYNRWLRKRQKEGEEKARAQ